MESGICLLCGLLLPLLIVQVFSETPAPLKLARDLFENHSTIIRPAYNHSKPTIVSVDMGIEAVLGLDTKRQILATIGFFQMAWTDEFLQWNASEYDDIDYLVIPQTQIWKPDLIVNNLVNERRSMGDPDTSIRLFSNGTIRWEPGFSLETSCKIDVSRYPFDKSICRFLITVWMNNNESVTLVRGPNKNIFTANPSLTGEFYISSKPSTSRQFIALNGLYYDQLLFNIVLQRRPTYFILSLLLPVVLLSIACCFSFLLDPDEPDKLSMSITILLSFTVFLGVIDNDLPETSDNLSFLVMYVSAMLAHGFLTVIGNVAVLKVRLWEESLNVCEDHGNRNLSMAMGDNYSVKVMDDLIRDDYTNHLADRERNNGVGKHSPDSKTISSGKLKRRSLARILNRVLLILSFSIVISLTLFLWIVLVQ